ncbi:MAG: hypothetical protein ABI359_06575 [Ginsengibacter sp.]
MNTKSIIITKLLLLFLQMAFGMQLCAQNRCDMSLPVNSKNPLSYHDLGDRCEGVYIQQLGSTALQVVSFTKSFEAYDLSSGKPLQITWDKFPSNNIIRVRARGIERKLYYRMDTYCSDEKNSFNWPVNILSTLNIMKPDIGVVGFTKYLINGKETDIYIPLTISQQKVVDNKPELKFVLLPGVELSEIYVSIQQIKEDGKPGIVVKEGEKLGYGYYPADRPVIIPISGLKGRGIYYLEAGATLRDGGTSSIEIWFYNPVE